MERRGIARLTLFSLVLATAAASGACRGILGIDEDVPLAPTGDGGPGDDATSQIEGGGEGGTDPDGGPNVDGAFDAGVMNVDRRFAVWPLPTEKPPLSNYDLTGSEVVVDKTTTLVWQRQESVPVSMSYSAGIAFCDGLTLGGRSDWRLPTRIEWLTILDYGQTNGHLNKTIFPDSAQAGGTIVWTDSLSLLRAKLTDRFLVDEDLGFVSNSLGNDQLSNLVRCVTGGPTTSPVNRYATTAGTAKDVRTGITWQVTPLATTKLQSEAKTACETLSLGGFTTGWRLPTVRELVSLVDESREQTPLVSPIFQPGPTAVFWTSTLRANPQSAYYSVDFDDANIHQDDFTIEKRSIRCVR